jgi:hypothetical protein
MAPTTPRKWKFALAIVASIWAISIAGGIWQRHQLTKQQFQLQQIITRLAADNLDFASLHPSRSSHPKVWIFGELTTQQEIDRLRSEVAKLYGDAEADRIVRVRVRVETTSQPSGA